MKPALLAEWTKLRTVPGPLWLLLTTAAATAALSAGAASVLSCTPAGCNGDVTRASLMGVQLGQAPVAVLAVLAISGEYGSGMIRTTLTAVPRRAAVLAAKAVTLAGVLAPAATAAVTGSLLAGRLALPSPADQALSLSHGPTLRAAVGSVLYLLLIALLSLGIATAVRDSATSIGIVLALLYVVPVVGAAIGDPHWQRLLQQTAPTSAGLAIQATTDLTSLPITPWAGLGVTAAWSFTALSTAALVLHKRDP
ncbi:ABC transporter permease [Streptomyces sp. NPDC101132]|uniref:ABC transporter permease n=1 Tax=Streptomyces sp. NPDC101132 TaxID=3366110 RepID=UPI0037FFBA36